MAERLQIARLIGTVLSLGDDVVNMMTCFYHPLFQVFLTQVIVSLQYHCPELSPLGTITPLAAAAFLALPGCPATFSRLMLFTVT